MSNGEKKLQVKYVYRSRVDWYLVSGILKDDIACCYNRDEALSADYLDIVQAKFPNMTFRSI